MNQDIPALSQTEWKAVTVAINDAANCGCASGEPGRLGRIFAALTGIERPKPLADPRLEALRLFVCDTRRSRKPAESLVPALIDQGYNPAQVRAIALLAA
ncbi:hypothetical protein [Sphingomonas quercus]|uniref:Uncharacterized protein n=1 Tax=Sphingomonas quercus TaxID=2842451 RepID=A0ABS6BKU2_9SPHN|nr:hypothetical protein [Sphingomonas quercus]MBU3078932.1 hypothetical protein [Sphingomonas quercus]